MMLIVILIVHVLFPLKPNALHILDKMDDESEEDDDTEYFRQEVGEEPDEGRIVLK